MDPRLAAIYAQIPNILCQGKCAPTCGVIPVHPLELKQIRHASGKRLRVTPFVEGESTVVLKPKRDRCPVLKNERCAVYDVRPLICRMYGVVEGLPCQFGCRAGRMLTRTEANALIRELNALA